MKCSSRMREALFARVDTVASREVVLARGHVNIAGLRTSHRSSPGLSARYFAQRTVIILNYAVHGLFKPHALVFPRLRKYQGGWFNLLTTFVVSGFYYYHRLKLRHFAKHLNERNFTSTTNYNIIGTLNSVSACISFTRSRKELYSLFARFVSM